MAVRREWRCTKCGKLLGVLEGDRLYIEFTRGHRYIVTLPATTVCRACHSLNEVTRGSAKS